MKRKHGNKKGKPKKHSAVALNEAILNVANLSTEDNSGMEDYNKDDVESGMEAETPSSTGTDPPEKLATNNSSGLVDKTPGRLVYGRVKVKIKTSKALDSQHTSPDVPMQSDTDNSSQQLGLEKLGIVGEKMEDRANALPEIKLGLLANESKKAGSIKIKSSRGFSSSSLSPCYNSGLVQGERTHQKEPSLQLDSQYSKQELDAALDVIKTVMKMDAAEPFNVPVNPIALGIPDYFDVIDTPMDFGTICSNLENGVKYMNSEDVYNDVKYIWENCYKYNNKGDYVVELMKRVKKNFAKYWTAAVLYSEQPQVNSDTESIQVKDVAPPIHGKMPVKSGHLKHKTGKRHKVKSHKDDCLCAICVMMRRRQEREESAQTVEDQIEISDGLSVQEVKPEGASAVESPCGEDTSSSMDNSQEEDVDADMEDKGEEVKMEYAEQPYSPFQEKHEEEDNNITFQTKEEREIGDRSVEMESDNDIQNDPQEETSMHHEDEKTAAQLHRPKELLDEDQKGKIYDNFRWFENPLLLELCGALFVDNNKSIWGGAHSIDRRQGSTCVHNSIHAAVATFMK